MNTFGDGIRVQRWSSPIDLINQERTDPLARVTLVTVDVVGQTAVVRKPLG